MLWWKDEQWHPSTSWGCDTWALTGYYNITSTTSVHTKTHWTLDIFLILSRGAVSWSLAPDIFWDLTCQATCCKQKLTSCPASLVTLPERNPLLEFSEPSLVAVTTSDSEKCLDPIFWTLISEIRFDRLTFRDSQVGNRFSLDAVEI